MDQLFIIIVNRGKANAVLNKIKTYGVKGGVIFFGVGTLSNRFVDKIGLTETHREILLLSVSDELSHQLHRATPTLLEANKDIAFSVPFKRFGLKSSGEAKAIKSNESSPAYFCIVTIVDRGRSKECVKAAKAAGSQGATVIHGRGAGVPAEYFVPLEIEPEKDIVLMIAERANVAPIRESISFTLELEKAGNGILYTLPITWMTGLFNQQTLVNREGGK